MTSEPTVFVVDDDQDARASVCALVRSLNGRCEQFASAEQFLASYEPHRSGCLVADLRMRGMSGLDLQEAMARRGWTIPVVLVSGYLNVQNAVRAMKEGAEQVLTKPYSEQDLWDAIQAAIRRDAELRAELSRRDGLKAKFARLTPVERQVLDLIAEGQPNKAVARRLDVGVRTVEDRRRRVMAKLGVGTFAEMMTQYGKIRDIEAESGAPRE